MIIADPAMPHERKDVIIRAFACAIRDILDCLPGPDMGTNEACMAWIRDEIVLVAVLPRALGGIPLDEIGATGIGIAAAVKVGMGEIGLNLAGSRVAVQGFGAVGQQASRCLGERGAILVAASDSHGTIADPAGLDLGALIAMKESVRQLTDYPA